MTETRKHRRTLPEDDGYIPPPSIFADRGFTAFAGADTAPYKEPEPSVPEQPGLSVQDVIEHIDPAPERDFRMVTHEAFLDDDEPLWTPKAPPAEQMSFNDLILGRGGADGSRSGEPDPFAGEGNIRHDRLATASLAVSLSGFVTVIGFPAGVLMGHAALRRIGPASWYHGTVKAEHRARNAVMIGYLGLAVLAVIALLLAAGWLLQTPVESPVPGLEVTDSSTLTTTTGGTP